MNPGTDEQAARARSLPARASRAIAKAPIHLYRSTFKAFAGNGCRHWPTCSDYALRAIDLNGAWRGLWLTVSRLARCGPGGSSGVDLPPDIRNERHLFAPWRYGVWRKPDNVS